MGSSKDWFKTIISRKKTRVDHSKKVKGSAHEQLNGFKWKNNSYNESNKFGNDASSGHPADVRMTIESIAATRIQTAFRRFKARKALRALRGIKRIQVVAQHHSVKNQASNTLNYIQSWSKIQSEIRTRRACMVTEGRIRQKKQENQLKLEAKLHDLEVEWCGGSETMEETVARIHLREEAAVKRERAMAYAFSHQWRANSGVNQGQFAYDLENGNWGWSWVDRWIAARPWETRLPSQSINPNKLQKKPASKAGKNIGPSSARRLSGLSKPTTAVADGNDSTKKTPQQVENNTDSQQKPVSSLKMKTKNGKLKQEQQILPQMTEIAC